MVIRLIPRFYTADHKPLLDKPVESRVNKQFGVLIDVVNPNTHFIYIRFKSLTRCTGHIVSDNGGTDRACYVSSVL